MAIDGVRALTIFGPQIGYLDFPRGPLLAGRIEELTLVIGKPFCD